MAVVMIATYGNLFQRYGNDVFFGNKRKENVHRINDRRNFCLSYLRYSSKMHIQQCRFRLNTIYHNYRSQVPRLESTFIFGNP